MSRFIQARRLWLCLAVLALAIGGFGCGTENNDAQNTSSKPWNSPEGYQNGGLPSQMQSR